MSEHPHGPWLSWHRAAVKGKQNIDGDTWLKLFQKQWVQLGDAEFVQGDISTVPSASLPDRD